MKAFHLSLDWFKLEEVPANASNSMQNADKSYITEARGWRSGLCGFCKLCETGHVCKECATLCCNLCNTLQVDELTDIMCPNCANKFESCADSTSSNFIKVRDIEVSFERNA